MPESITPTEAYRAMFAFLEAYYERTQADDIGALLSDLQLDREGKPFDPAVTADWAQAIQKALSQK